MSWLSCLCFLAALGAVPAETAPVLPHTVERVWYRGEDRPFGKVFRAGGDLVIREDSLEFVHRKHGWSVPLEGISMIALGVMKGDVDTDWVILVLRDGQPERVVGIRDGHRLGYGRETRGIYELLREVARSRKVAQFDVPEGLEPYEQLDRMLAVAFPAGWHPLHLSRSIDMDHVLPLGRTSFTPDEVEIGGPVGRGRYAAPGGTNRRFRLRVGRLQRRAARTPAGGDHGAVRRGSGLHGRPDPDQSA